MAISQFKATTADFLSSVKNKALIPTNQNTYQNSDILSLADDEIQIGLLPQLLATREEHLKTYKDYASGTSDYWVPQRAIGESISHVTRVVNSKEYPVTRIEPEEQHLYETDDELCYYIRDNKLIFLTTPTDTIRVHYARRPSHLIETSACGKVTAVSGADITLDAVPSTYTTSLTYDVVSPSAPRTMRATDATITTIDGTTVTFSSAPSGIAVGDYVCLAGQSPIIDIPYDLIPVLTLRTVVTILDGLGDDQAMKRAQAKLMEAEANTAKLLEPRVEKTLHKVINHNSILRTTCKI